MKLVPVIVTAVATGPLVGVKPLIVGAGGVTVKLLALVAVPPGVVTVIGPAVAPVGHGGGDLGGGVDGVAGGVAPLNLTAVAPVKSLPLIVTELPTSQAPAARAHQTWDLVLLHLEPRGRGGGQRRRDRGDARSPGHFAEAIRAGGAGIGGFFTPVGAGTLLAENKEERLIGGVPHVLEEPIRADVALVYAARADELGNLWYRRTARNFNPLMATAATITIAEAGEIVRSAASSRSRS